MILNNIYKYFCFLFFVLLLACNQKEITAENQSQASVFPKGEEIISDNFTGTVWLHYLSKTDTIYNVNIGSVTFNAGARTHWHYHKGGQILLVTDGEGLYQERGKYIELIKKGSVMKCPPNIEHWHGATPKKSMTHIAIGTNTNIGGVVWLQAVTDEEYRNSDLLE